MEYLLQKLQKKAGKVSIVEFIQKKNILLCF